MTRIVQVCVQPGVTEQELNCIDQMISDVGPIDDVQHLDPLWQVVVAMTSFWDGSSVTGICSNNNLDLNKL